MAIRELKQEEINVVSGGASLLGLDLGGLLAPVLGIVDTVLSVVVGLLNTVVGVVSGLWTTVKGLLSGI